MYRFGFSYVFAFLILLSANRSFFAQPQDVPFVENAAFLWGPYRPNLYLGLRPRVPKSLLIGLMWADTSDPSGALHNLRHTCEQDEGMASYGWITYDTLRGGTQIINDTKNNLDLIIDFVKILDDDHQGRWGLRVAGISRTGAQERERKTAILYISSEDPTSRIECVYTNNSSSQNDVICSGTANGLGEFSMEIRSQFAIGDHYASLSINSMNVSVDSIWQAKSIFTNRFEGNTSWNRKLDSDREANLHFISQDLDQELGFEFDVLLSTKPLSEKIKPDYLTSKIENAHSAFISQFERTYTPQNPFQNEQYVKLSHYLLSNLMGGIGYFYGTSKVQSSVNTGSTEEGQAYGETASSKEALAVVEERGPYELFSSVPSRPFFPRGFLWDEGFHLLVILPWDLDLAITIVTSWLDLMDEQGWIAREQILGPEARSKVPEEFQVQFQHFANPPTLFLVIQEFVAVLDGQTLYSGAKSRYLTNLSETDAWLSTYYPKVKKHYEWFRLTQAGNLTNYQLPGAEFREGYRWRGWTSQHILTSGLDDYPRVQPPHPEGLHVDAISWIGCMATVLEEFSFYLNEPDDYTAFAMQKEIIMKSIDAIHWSDLEQSYCDSVIVDGVRVETVCHKGYVSLTPFLVGLIHANHPRLESILDLIRDPEELWSPYGLRSLSIADKYYGTDENYWRSPIWININFMVLQRLWDLARHLGPHQSKAREIYYALRLNLCNTVFNSWKETNFAWEQYNAETGRGQRTQHFTGWTALIVRILAMPELHPGTQPQAPELSDDFNRRDYWRITTYEIVGIGMCLILLIYRRRLFKFWRLVFRVHPNGWIR